ncbi:hypothetical protein [Chromobacterium alticapitis]|uniref:hypothetical protein n=1 Tax=Chromobacterium alticapitis TaxID=2073169 RepID=UPI0011B05566|nr:hypothetical protein [Chromobacterium alticapitis]
MSIDGLSVCMETIDADGMADRQGAGIKRGRSGKGEPRRPKKKQLAVQRVGTTGMSANPLFSLEQMAQIAREIFTRKTKQDGLSHPV